MRDIRSHSRGYYCSWGHMQRSLSRLHVPCVWLQVSCLMNLISANNKPLQCIYVRTDRSLFEVMKLCFLWSTQSSRAKPVYQATNHILKLSILSNPLIFSYFPYLYFPYVRSIIGLCWSAWKTSSIMKIISAYSMNFFRATRLIATGKIVNSARLKK